MLILAALVVCGSCGGPAKPGQEEIDRALEDVRIGEAPAAILRLERLLEIHPEGRIGDRAALVLGKVLIDRERHGEALDHLARAARGTVAPSYATLLRVRAITAGGLEERYEEALAEAAGLLESDPVLVRPLVREEAQFLALKLYSVRQQWQEAQATGIDFLDSWPRSQYLDEARWLTAEAVRHTRRQNQAAELYATIWYETPASPWAVEARQRSSGLEAATGTVARRLSADERYDFISALQSVGLHEAALEEVARFLSASPSDPRADRALAMRAKSQHALRRNPECVATVKELRRRYPGSPSLPRAAIYAIKALRRKNNTAQIRQWAGWLADRYAGEPEATEALYNLGDYLSNVVSEEEGLSVLERAVATGGENPAVDDALWKAAWIHRRLGDTPRAIATLEKLLDEQPGTGYRRPALYWSARFLAERDARRALSLFQQCVEEFPHSYYGHQSLENLVAMGAEPRQIGSRDAFPDVGLLDDLGSASELGEEVRAAAYLKSVGLYRFAAAELATFAATRVRPGQEVADEDLGLQYALADLYSRSEETWEAIEIVNRHFKSFVVAGSRDPDLVPREFWYIVYPYNYRASIQKAIQEAGLGEAGIDPYLVAALIRQESLFLPTAISPVGALGLMQLMPKTAAALADERGLPGPSRSELFNPSTNIRYGTFYLAQRVREFQGDWFPAICSYNAGPGAVKRWWRNRPPGQAIDEFVESIPYSATRQYIKRVLGDYRNYEWLYRQDA